MRAPRIYEMGGEGEGERRTRASHTAFGRNTLLWRAGVAHEEKKLKSNLGSRMLAIFRVGIDNGLDVVLG